MGQLPDPELAHPDDVRKVQLLKQWLRLDARERLLSHSRLIFPLPPPRHYTLMCRALQKWVFGEIPNLMIFAPPRHMKSWAASWSVPTWILGIYPRAQIMHITHTQAFADRMGRRIRNTIGGDGWAFDEVEVSADNSAKASWSTNQGGGYLAFGADGSPTGSPANFLIVDDLLKGRKEADSATVRENHWEFWQSDLITRLEKFQGQPPRKLFTATRWVDDDIPGRILPEGYDGRSGWFEDRETGERWCVLSLPAMSEHPNDPAKRKEGEWLWPEQRGEDVLGKVKVRGGRTWSALYQCRPAPDDGLLVKSEWIKTWEPKTAPRLETMQIYGASDFAVTDESLLSHDPDFTVHGVFGVAPDRRVYLLDLWRGRTDPKVSIDAMLTMIEMWRPLQWAHEAGVIKKALGPLIERMSIERSNENRKAGRPAVWVGEVEYTSDVNKTARAQSLIGLIASGQFYLPRQHPEYSAIRRELLQFPVAKHDDIVDACSLFCRMLGDVVPGSFDPILPDEKIAGTMKEVWQRHQEHLGEL